MDEDMNFSSDSEKELTEKERKLLANVRKPREEENFDSDDEVLGFDDDESEDEGQERDSMESDIENLEEDDDMPDEKAWGKKKSTYYGTDYVDQDYSTVDHNAQVLAELEEEEARKIQKRLTEQMEDVDFGLDTIIKRDETEKQEVEKEYIQTDFSQMSERQKWKLLEKESPEFMVLLNDCKERLDEIQLVLKPFYDLATKEDCEDNSTVQFVKTKLQLLLNYCINVSFYLMLKAKRMPVTSHPVMKRLAQYRLFIKQLEDKSESLIPQVKEILNAYQSGETIYKTSDNSQITRS